jgi:hypothetical protein
MQATDPGSVGYAIYASNDVTAFMRQVPVPSSFPTYLPSGIEHPTNVGPTPAPLRAI